MNKLKLFLPVLLLVGGLVAGVTLVLQNQDLRSKAFTGFGINTTNVSQSIIDNPSPLSSIPADSSSAQYLYHELAQTYPTAATQNIQQDGVELTGTASLAYDEEIDTTLVFIRLENVPYFEFTPMNLWFHNVDTNKLARVAIAEFTVEDSKPVAYFVYSAAGDLRQQYQLAYISYEEINQTEPLLPIITLNL